MFDVTFEISKKLLKVILIPCMAKLKGLSMFDYVAMCYNILATSILKNGQMWTLTRLLQIWLN